MDVFRRTSGDKQYCTRLPNGGRLEYTKEWFYATINAYCQYGENASSGSIRACYVQHEVSANNGRTLARLGAEVLSGNKSTVSSNESASLVPLYSVAWKFMGNVNLFTRFPADVDEKGLVNPYLFIIYQAGKFDIPKEYGQKVSEQDQMQVALGGLQGLLSLLGKHNIRATFFTTGYFASKNPALVRQLAAKHEIASHALLHSPMHIFRESDIEHSRKILESVSGQPVKGFRMPRLKPFDKGALLRLGLRYDSSLNPTWLPGRYNLLSEDPLPSRKNGLIELPCSTVPWLRLPLFWLSFKNLPLSLYVRLCRFTLHRRGNLMLYFHPWEFADLSGYQLPFYVRRRDGEKLLRRLDRLIQDLKNPNVQFVSCDSFCDHWESERVDLGAK